MVIFNCINLVGDSLYLLKPIDLYLEKYPGDCVALIIQPNNIGGEIIKAHFGSRLPVLDNVAIAKQNFPEAVLLNLPAGRAAEVTSKVAASHSKQLHISQGYGLLIGVDVVDPTPPLTWVSPRKPIEGNVAIIAPFSASCSRHTNERPNKTLDDWKWEHIIRYLRRHDFEVQCIGGPSDVLQNVSLPISSYRTAPSLQALQDTLQQARLVVCVEGGIGHLASAFDVPTIILWPQVSNTGFIAPGWAPRTSYLMIGDPNTVAPAAVLYGIKKLVTKLVA